MWENLAYNVTFVLQFFFEWQVIGNVVTKHQHPYRYALVLLRPKMLDNRLGILT